MKRPTTTKVLMAYIFINCTAIEVYSMVAMWHLSDLSALYSLITSVVTETMAFAVYCAKAYSETREEERIKLERDRLDIPAPEASVGGGSLDSDERGEEDD